MKERWLLAKRIKTGHLYLDLSVLTIPIAWKLGRYGYPVLHVPYQTLEIVCLLTYLLPYSLTFLPSVQTHFHHKRAAISKKQAESLDLKRVE